jgi:hypothetical protein
MRPARRFGAPGAVPYGPPFLAADARGRAIAVAKMSFREPSGVGALGARSIFGGEWRRHTELGPRGPMVSQPQPVLLPDGRALVVFARVSAVLNDAVTPEYEVVVTEDLGPPTAIGAGLRTLDGRGVSVDARDATVIVAWPGPDGVLVATRTP